jgi:hypothetical protein
MKIKNDKKNFFKTDNFTNQDTKIDRIKTTDINILLNRVRSDKKNKNKKIILLSITVIVSLLFFCFLIY